MLFEDFMEYISDVEHDVDAQNLKGNKIVILDSGSGEVLGLASIKLDSETGDVVLLVEPEEE